MSQIVLVQIFVFIRFNEVTIQHCLQKKLQLMKWLSIVNTKPIEIKMLDYYCIILVAQNMHLYHACFIPHHKKCLPDFVLVVEKLDIECLNRLLCQCFFFSFILYYYGNLLC